jgi:hypothetical protein
MPENNQAPHMADSSIPCASHRRGHTGMYRRGQEDPAGSIIVKASYLAEVQSRTNEDLAVRTKRFKAEVRPVFLPSLDGVRVDYM